ncbi:MAG TPA: DegT/DnrJ/EryC1/StrS family aminotransferase [Bdellovibrionales bacterium]|nr:MAG: pyridoxal-5'-phosphate-dependent protein [Bdellovibrionales bacterium GWB1_52_6]OFZ05213.1 MAG: pyridoxal-5'-phosphate-dependent protein [Bdellovibrionales bacterium GWA1_52_35]HAR43980.1 DegT/DnrJ/EryC1/StrS family aminotransferase [Bdellovibrionales bacterium]HCM38656.1 DegT/DnrJ/EryC1/StrS family aminotransferase [Bdellovibrionales bacterium]
MIQMNDFKSEPQQLRQAMLGAVQRVLESGWYVLGNEVIAFEKQWAAACGVPYAIGVGNGMDAIEISLRALKIGPGDEVITTPMTAFATVLAILRAGATPVLADIDSETTLLSIESAARCLTSKTKAVVLVHLYGQVRQMGAWVDFCDAHKINLIEDCAQAHLASWKGKYAGSFGATGAFSFYPTKNLGAPGDAGMIVTSNEEVAKLAARLRNYGQSVRYHHPEIGMNSRLDEIQAAILGERLKWLPEFSERRRQIVESYKKGILNPMVRLPAPPEEPSAHAYHLFVLTCEHRPELEAHLQKNGVQSLIHYPIPIHKQTCCGYLARDRRGLTNSEKHAATCLSLPCHPQMTSSDIATVISAVNSFS